MTPRGNLIVSILILILWERKLVPSYTSDLDRAQAATSSEPGLGDRGQPLVDVSLFSPVASGFPLSGR